MDMKKIPKPRMEEYERKQRREREKYERQQVQSAAPEYSLFSEPIRVNPSECDDDITAKLGEYSEAKEFISSNTIGISNSLHRQMPPNAVLPGLMPTSASSSINNNVVVGAATASASSSSSSLSTQSQQRLQMPPPTATTTSTSSSSNSTASSTAQPQQQLPHHYQQQQQQSHQPPYLKQADNKPPYNGRGGYPGQPVKNDLRSSSGMAPPKGPPQASTAAANAISSSSSSTNAAANTASSLQPPATTIMPNGRAASGGGAASTEKTFLGPPTTNIMPTQNGRFPQPKSRQKSILPENDIQISSILKEMVHYRAPDEHITKIAPTPHNTIAADYNLNGPNKFKYAFIEPMKSPPAHRASPISALPDLPVLPGLPGIPSMLMQSAPITPIGALPATPSSATVATNNLPLTAAAAPALGGGLTPVAAIAATALATSHSNGSLNGNPNVAVGPNAVTAVTAAAVSASTASLLRPKEPIKPWKPEKASPHLEKQNSTLENDLELSESDDDRKRQTSSPLNSSESSQSDSSESSEESERSHHSQLQTPLAVNTNQTSVGAGASTGGAMRTQNSNIATAKTKQNHQTITASGNNTISSMLIGSGFGSAGSSSSYSGPSSTSSSNKTPSPSDSNKWNLRHYFKAAPSLTQQNQNDTSSTAAAAAATTTSASSSSASVPVPTAATSAAAPTAVVVPSTMNVNSMSVSMNMPTMLPGGAQIIPELTPQQMAAASAVVKSEKLTNGQADDDDDEDDGDDDEDDEDDDDDEDDEDEDGDCDSNVKKAGKGGGDGFRHPGAASVFGSRKPPGLSVTPVSPVREIKKELSFDDTSKTTCIKTEEDPYSSITGLSNLSSDTNSSDADEAPGPFPIPGPGGTLRLPGVPAAITALPRSPPGAAAALMSKPTPTLPNSLTVTKIESPLPATSPSTAGRKNPTQRTKKPRKKLKPQQQLPPDSSDEEDNNSGAYKVAAAVATAKADKHVPADSMVSMSGAPASALTATGVAASTVTTKKGRGRPRKTASNQSGNISSASSTAKGPTPNKKVQAAKKPTGRRLSRQNSSSATSTQGSTPTKVSVAPATVKSQPPPPPAVIPPTQIAAAQHGSSDESSSSSSGSSSSSSTSDSEEAASGAGSASSSDEESSPAANAAKEHLRIAAAAAAQNANSGGRSAKATAQPTNNNNNKRKLSSDDASNKNAIIQPNAAKKGRQRVPPAPAPVVPEVPTAATRGGRSSSTLSSSSSEESSAEDGQISGSSGVAVTLPPANSRTQPPQQQQQQQQSLSSTAAKRNQLSSSCSSASSSSASSSSGEEQSDSDCKGNRKDKKLRRDKPKSDKNKLNTLTRIFTPKEGGAKKQGQVMIVEEPLSKEQQLLQQQQQQQQQQKHVSPNAVSSNFKSSQENLAAQYSSTLTTASQSPRLTPGHKKSPRNALLSGIAQRTPDRCSSSAERKLQQRIRTPTRTPPTRTPPTSRTRTPTPTSHAHLTAKMASPARVPLLPSLICKIDLSRLTHIPPEWHSNPYRLHAAATTSVDRRSSTPSVGGGNHTPSATAMAYGAGRTPIYDHETILNADLQAANQLRLRGGPASGSGGGSTPRSLGSRTPTQVMSLVAGADREMSRSRESLHSTRLDEVTTNGRLSSRSTDGASTPKDLLPPPPHLTPNGYRGCFPAMVGGGGNASPSAKLISPGSVKYEHNIKYEPDADPAYDAKYTKPTAVKQENLILKHEIKGGAADGCSPLVGGENSPIESKPRRKRSSSASSSPYKEKKRKKDKSVNDCGERDRDVGATAGGGGARTGANLKQRELDQQLMPTNHDRLMDKSGMATTKRQLNNNTNVNNNNNNSSPAHLIKPVPSSNTQTPPPPIQTGPTTQNSTPLQVPALGNNASGGASTTTSSGVGGSSSMTNTTPSTAAASGSDQVPPKVIYRSYFERDDDALKRQLENTRFLNEAVRRKHLADSEKKPFTQVTIYLEAVVYFLLSGAALEEHHSSEEAAWKMYRDTLALIKFISTKFKNLQDDEYTTKVLILSLRCQSLMSLKLYTLKRNFCRSISQSCNEFFNNNRNDIINGNTPSSISPSNSVWSQGSGSNTPPGRLVPQTIHSYLRQQNQFFNYLANSHELWDQADKLVRQGNHTDFFIALDHENGPLTLHSSMYEVFRYVHAGLNKLNTKRSIQ